MSAQNKRKNKLVDLDEEDYEGNNAQNSENIYRTSRLLMITLAAALGGFPVGYHCGIVAGAQIYLPYEYPNITVENKARFVSLAFLGAAICSFFAGTIANKVGRKMTMILACCSFIAGSVVLALAMHVVLLYLGRFIVGIGIGFSIVGCQVYLSECAPDRYRDQMVQVYWLNFFIGLILSYILPLILPYRLSILFLIPIISNVIQIFMVLFTIQESPMFLLTHGHSPQAFANLKQIYDTEKTEGKQELDRHFKQIQHECEQNNQQTGIVQCIVEIVTVYRRNLLIGVFLHILQQFTGINCILFYGPSFLKDSGFIGEKETSVLYAMIFLGFMLLLGNIIYFLYGQKVGRRKLMLFSIPFLGFSILTIEIMMILNMFSGGFRFGGYITILSLAVFIMFYSLGFASQPWAICTEIFPNHLRGNANSLTTVTNWLTNYFVTAAFLKITDGEIGKLVGYSILVMGNFLCFFFIKGYILETGGKSMEEIVSLYKYAIADDKTMYGDNQNTNPNKQKRKQQKNHQDDNEEGLLDKKQSKKPAKNGPSQKDIEMEAKTQPPRKKQQRYQ
eukprot:403364656